MIFAPIRVSPVFESVIYPCIVLFVARQIVKEKNIMYICLNRFKFYRGINIMNRFFFDSLNLKGNREKTKNKKPAFSLMRVFCLKQFMLYLFN
tara:strand:- start:360 stop:638 length:279 start_codon:yes stop_codon:yes gene_type:complete